MRVCVVGAGIIAEDHLRAIRQMPDVELAGIADIVREKADALAAQYGGRAYVDYREMIDAERPDAAIITLPHKLHAESAVFCVQRGVHVLMEKPMAVSTDDCDLMIDAARLARVKLMIAHIGHYLPANLLARDIIISGELGELMMIADTRNTDYFTAARPAWFLRKDLAGGGIFMNLGAHSVDKILFLAGSRIQSITGKARLKEGLDVECAAQAFLRLENGVTATVNCNGCKTTYLDETMLYFTHGTVRLHTGKGVWVSRGGEYEPRALPDAGDPFTAQLADFLACIVDDTDPPISGEHGRNVIEAIETVYRC